MDPKSTSEIQLIAGGMVEQQARVCQVRQDNVSEKLEALAVATSANAKAITELTQTVSVLSSAVEASSKREHDTAQEIETVKETLGRMRNRPAVMAGLGALLGGLAPFLIELFKQ